eukprot:TRINITY_DN1562_c0_g1_i1.p1 TRINITY_DN1562_c0_g1~~TRINITY_DN1562_c0_g1_i1.p1  ORF type:complete len:186 (+),score=65.54 TRINITY_DN1562_c0_g1_i1:118-675(+)
MANVKALTPQDRVLIVGNTRAPWGLDMKEAPNVFQKYIYTVMPTYSSLLLVWESFVKTKKVDLTAGLDVHTLANLSCKGYKLDHENEKLAMETVGYTVGAVKQVVDQALNPRRLKKLGSLPVTTSEFLNPLSRAKPVSAAELKALKDFVKTLPPDQRKRTAEDNKPPETPEDDKKGKGKAKPKKK